HHQLVVPCGLKLVGVPVAVDVAQHLLGSAGAGREVGARVDDDAHGDEADGEGEVRPAAQRGGRVTVDAGQAAVERHGRLEAVAGVQRHGEGGGVEDPVQQRVAVDVHQGLVGRAAALGVGGAAGEPVEVGVEADVQPEV